MNKLIAHKYSQKGIHIGNCIIGVDSCSQNKLQSNFTGEWLQKYFIWVKAKERPSTKL